MVSHSKLEELFKARIAIINQYGKELAKVKTIRPVAWFGNYLTKELNGLSFHLFSPKDKNDFIRLDVDSNRSFAKFNVNEKFLSLIAHMAEQCSLEDDDPILPYVVENFIVHEIVHHCQGMARGGHSGLTALASNVILENDYQADAMAVIILFFIRCLEEQANKNFRGYDDKENTGWPLYQRLIEAIFYQIQIFSLFSEATDKEPEKLLTTQECLAKKIAYTRWERLAIWHFQYWRAEFFDNTQALTNFQILFRPTFSFRHQYTASNKYLNADWPKKERSILSDLKITMLKNQFCIGSLNDFGLRNAVVFTFNNETLVNDFFEAVFTGNPSKSRAFFNLLFSQHPELLGDGSSLNYNNSDSNPPPDSPTGPDFPITLEQLFFIHSGVESVANFFRKDDPLRTVVAQAVDDLEAFYNKADTEKEEAKKQETKFYGQD